MFRSACFLAIVGFACSGLGVELPLKRLEKLAAEIQVSLDARKAAPTAAAPTSEHRDPARSSLISLRTATAAGEIGQAQAALEQLAVIVDSESLRAQCVQTAADLRGLREARQKQARAEVSAVLQRATDAVRRAQKPNDLDATLQELGKLRGQFAGSQVAGHSDDILSQIEPALQFVPQWQNYLAQTGSGDAKAAQETLDRLVRDNRSTLLPRSELLARRYGGASDKAAAVQPTPRPSPTPEPPPLFDLRSPNDLHPAAEKLAELLRDPKIGNDEKASIRRLYQSISALANVWQEFGTGLPTKLEVILSDEARYDHHSAITSGMRALLLKLVLPRYLGLPSDAKVGDNESPPEFLRRVSEEAIRNKDFTLAARARETARLLRDGKALPGAENSQSGLFITAQNQELAGQFSLAVTSYQRALASGSDLVPPAVIGQRLARIKSEHPTEFQKGLDDFLTPRMPTFPSGPAYGSYPPGFPPPGHPMNRPGPAPPPASLVLDVPAAEAPKTTPGSAQPPSTP